MFKITVWVFLLIGFYLCKAHLWSDLRTLYQWKQLEFDFPNENARENAIKSGEFKPGQILPIDVDASIFCKSFLDYNYKYFITIPRFQAGVPVTLGRVTNKKYRGNPIIAPYPSWEWQNFTGSECKPDRLVSVFRTAIDVYCRLWVLDSGFGLEKVECPPQLVAFDLKTDKLLHRYEFPSNQYTENSTFVTPIVEVGRNPDDTFVYCADVSDNTIVVYHLKNNVSWLVKDKSMNPSPQFTSFTLAGTNYTSYDGVLGMALSPRMENGDRYLFYHALAGETETKVSTSVLKQEERFKNNSTSSPESFITYSPGRGTQSAAEVFDKNGNLYFGMLSDITINCWNLRTNYTRANFDVIADNKEDLQFPSGMKVIKSDLLLITTRFQRAATGTLNSSDTNFRILRGNIKRLTRGTRCQSGNGFF